MFIITFYVITQNVCIWQLQTDIYLGRKVYLLLAMLFPGYHPLNVQVFSYNFVVFCFYILYCYLLLYGDRCGTVVKEPCYKSEGRWFNSK